MLKPDYLPFYILKYVHYHWQMIESRFNELLVHAKILLRKKWLFGVFDDFVTKQLPHNVTWGLSLLYAMEHKADRSLTSTQGDTGHIIYICFMVC